MQIIKASKDIAAISASMPPSVCVRLPTKTKSNMLLTSGQGGGGGGVVRESSPFTLSDNPAQKAQK